MIPSGLPELTSIQDLKYVRDALQPQTTDAEATIFFTRYDMLIMSRCKGLGVELGGRVLIFSSERPWVFIHQHWKKKSY